MISVVILVALSCNTSIAALAFDAASDSAYDDGWQPLDNGGTGFGPWTFVSSSDPNQGGFFIGDSSNNGTPPSGHINTGGESFGLYANSFTTTYAARAFSNGPLQVGETFSIAMDNGTVQGGASVGFFLDTNFNPFDAGFPLIFRSTGGTYSAVDSAGVRPTGIPTTEDGLRVAVTLTSPTTYSLAINGAPTLTGTFGGTNPMITSLILFNGNAGAGPSADAFFNSLSVVPEPGALVLPIMTLLGLATVAVRRWFAA
jgi:hypothetical protein